MDDGADDVAPGPISFDELLLANKLMVPEARPGLVSRAELITSARSSGCRVVALNAPAGYGKTTLLSEWATSEDRRVAWVSLDRFDDDPTSLLNVMATAYARISPTHAGLPAALATFSQSALGRAAPLLASAFRTSPEPFVILLDDLHALRQPECHDVLSVAISGIPRGSQLVVASRHEQPYLGRLRASGEALELGVDDLSFADTHARSVFARAGVSLTDDGAAELMARTEGWPIGVHLAATIARNSDLAAPFIAGDDRDVADYLYGQSLDQLSEDDRRFLRRTSVLDQLNASLCDAVLDESGSGDRLRRLEGAASFLVAVDRQRNWYRYHALFREFLSSDLRRVEPDMVAVLHARAADWYEANGSRATAVEHLLRTSERARAAGLVTELVHLTYGSGHVSTVERWLEMLGDDAIEAHPPLAVLAGWIMMFDGRADACDRWLARCETMSFVSAPRDGTSSFESGRAMLRAMMCPAGPEQMVADAQFAAASEPSWSPWHHTAVGLLGLAYVLAGDVDAGLARLRQVSSRSTGTPTTDPRIVVDAVLSIAAMDRGDWAEAAEYAEPVLTMIEDRQMHDYTTAMLAFSVGARLATHRRDADAAERYLALAMRSRARLTYALPIIAVSTRLQLAKVYLSIADAVTARHLMREIDDILAVRPELGSIVGEVASFRRQLSAATQSGPAGAPPLTPAELRLLPYLQTHLTIREIADRLYVSRNTVNSEVTSIYRKLGVSSRSEAVHRAATVGLLG